MKYDSLVANGISAITGHVETLDLDLSAIVQSAIHEGAPGQRSSFLTRLNQTKTGSYRGPLLNSDRPHDYRDAGWGIIFHSAELNQLHPYLEPLIQHRKERLIRAGREQRFRILEYREGETFFDWITRYEGDPGIVNPDRVPYYLLVIGSPIRIPFEFSQDLDLVYCVGRLAFESDQLDRYKTYAEALVEYETSAKFPISSGTLLFSTHHEGDTPTQLSSSQLMAPLHQWLCKEMSNRGSHELVSDENATKSRLCALFEHTAQRPAFVFTATHGVTFPYQHNHQRSDQGGLICDDWPGSGAPARQHYVCADDIPDNADLSGTILFCFACYSAGTPQFDLFTKNAEAPETPISPEPFVSALGQRVISVRGGAALAAVGHVGRAWAFSFQTPRSKPVVDVFQFFISAVLNGKPVGLAMDAFNTKYAALSAELQALGRKRNLGAAVPEDRFVDVWIARNDAGSYVLLGDPAASIREGAMLERVK